MTRQERVHTLTSPGKVKVVDDTIGTIQMETQLWGVCPSSGMYREHRE